MALQKDHVLVLKSVDFSEADRILTVFGRLKGKFGIIAKGIRKMESKNRGNIQTLTISKISYFEGQNLGVLREAEATHNPDFRTDQIENAHKFIYLLNKLMPEDESDEVVFKMILDLYTTDFSLRDVNRFRLKLLQHLGYMPDLKSCSRCGESKPLVYISTVDFRMMCEECYQSNTSEKSLYQNVKDFRYESPKMTRALEDYIKGVIDA